MYQYFAHNIFNIFRLKKVKYHWIQRLSTFWVSEKHAVCLQCLNVFAMILRICLTQCYILNNSVSNCFLPHPFSKYSRTLLILWFVQHARIVEDWTGLRPVRSKVRLERETIQSGAIAVEVITWSPLKMLQVHLRVLTFYHYHLGYSQLWPWRIWSHHSQRLCAGSSKALWSNRGTDRNRAKSSTVNFYSDWFPLVHLVTCCQGRETSCIFNDN